jgi:hypothetical protein
VIAFVLRRFLVTGDVGVTELHAVSLPAPQRNIEAVSPPLVACLESLQHENFLLFEFAADYSVDDDAASSEAVLARTCDVLRRHRHTLRRLKLPACGRDGTLSASADALAECTAITSLDFSGMALPFRSWQQLGPTLRTLVVGIIGDGGDTGPTFFRLLADNMPALRELQLFTFNGPSQDGFIELVSRLRSLSVRTRGRPWNAADDGISWPQTLPSLEELLWCADGGVDAVAVAVLRRAVSLRAADVSHASALAAVAAGPPVVVAVNPSMYHAPLANIRTLALNAIINDPLSLSKSLTTSPRASTVTLRWGGTGLDQWDLLRAVASNAPPGREEEGAAEWRRVRRVRLEVDFIMAEPDPEAAVRCVRALFPRVRYASWSLSGLMHNHTMLPLLPECPDEIFASNFKI